MRHRTAFINLILAVSLLFGLAFVCGDSGPSDETVISLVKRGFKAYDGSHVGPVGKAWIISRDEGSRVEHDGNARNHVYWITVGLSVQGDSSPRKYNCQFYINRNDSTDEWKVGVCMEK
jgi:hypothetical protein